MQKKDTKIKKIMYMKPRKVNGGVGAKKQSLHQTPIRLSNVSQNYISEYTSESSNYNWSNSKITSYKILKSPWQMRKPKPNLPISMSIDMWTPKDEIKNNSNSKGGTTVMSKFGNTLLNHISKHTADEK